MSAKLSGRISRSSARIGPPSSWNTPSVSPRASNSYAGLSSSGRALPSGPVTLRATLTQIRALFYLGRSQEAATLADEALVRARALGQPTLIAQALSLRGYMEVASTEADVARGVGLLQEAIRRTLSISDQAGVRALLTHPIDDEAAGFYLRFGFETSPAREQQLLLLFKDARRVLTRPVRES